MRKKLVKVGIDEFKKYDVQNESSWYNTNKKGVNNGKTEVWDYNFCVNNIANFM